MPISHQDSLKTHRNPVEDINEMKRLREVSERFQGIYNASQDAIAFASFDGTLIDINDAFVSLTGYSREELLSGTKSSRRME